MHWSTYKHLELQPFHFRICFKNCASRSRSELKPPHKRFTHPHTSVDFRIPVLPNLLRHMAAWRKHRREHQRASPPIARRHSRLVQQGVRHSLLRATATESQRAGRLAAFQLRQRQRTAAESAEDRKLAVVPLAHKRAPASATQHNLLTLAPQYYAFA